MTPSKRLADSQAQIRLERLESVEAVRYLAARWALAYDARDVDALGAILLDPPDWSPMFAASDVSFHLVGAHVIDVVGPDDASGTVQCRAEHQHDGRWWVLPMLYFDDYVRRDGQWRILRREAHSFPATLLTGEVPTDQPNALLAALHVEPDLPHRWETWRSRWSSVS